MNEEEIKKKIRKYTTLRLSILFIGVVSIMFAFSYRSYVPLILLVWVLGATIVYEEKKKELGL